jgi:hypothetical protein
MLERLRNFQDAPMDRACMSQLPREFLALLAPTFQRNNKSPVSRAICLAVPGRQSRHVKYLRSLNLECFYSHHGSQCPQASFWSSYDDNLHQCCPRHEVPWSDIGYNRPRDGVRLVEWADICQQGAYIQQPFTTSISPSLLVNGIGTRCLRTNPIQFCRVNW